MWLVALLVWGMGQPQVGSARPDEEPVEPVKEALGDAGEDAVPVRIYVRNQMSDRFRLVEARVALDDMEVVHETARAGQELERNFSALETVVAPGAHALTATLIYEGRNPGSFGHPENDRYRVQTVYPFSLDAVGAPADVHLVARERSGASLPSERKLVLEAMSAPGSGVTPTPRVTGGAARNIVKAPAP
jgi:hypothetical protein